MPTEVVLPQLGESVAEGVITRWLKKPGDAVSADEPLVEISTDKVNVELPAPASGIVQELLAKEGDTVPVEKVIATIAPAGEAPVPESVTQTREAAATAESAESAATPAALDDEIRTRGESLEPHEEMRPGDSGTRGHGDGEPPARGEGNGVGQAVGERHVFSPLVRRIAREHNLDLARLVDSGHIHGTGESGRVTKADILAYVSSPAPAPIPAVTPPPEAPSPVSRPPSPEDIIIPFTGMRKMIADHLVRSAFTAPHVTTVAQADVTKLVSFRAANKDTWEKEYGLKLTYTPFFVKAATDALLAFPMVNSSLQGDKIIAKKVVHMGVAVSLGEGGLIVPVIKDAHTKDLITIARELDSLAKKARAGQLAPGDVQGGTFSITNPGVFGAIISTPIIVQPQSAILGVETIQKMPFVREDDSIAIRSMMYLCLSYDHRVVDGETAIKFLQHIRATLEAFRFMR